MSKCGVYAIVNKENGHRYIGSSRNVLNRWYQHKTHLRKGTHINNHLQRAWNKYGEDNFEFILLLECTPDELIENEQTHIDGFSPEYNIVPFARTGRGNQGRSRPDNIARNKTFRSKGHTGCLHSDETKAKMSAAWVKRKERGLAENWNSSRGKILSTETRAKISAATKGRIHSPEARAKISAKLMGHSMSPERIEKSAAKQRGRKLSPERIQGMKDGRAAAKAKREAEQCQP